MRLIPLSPISGSSGPSQQSSKVRSGIPKRGCTMAQFTPQMPLQRRRRSSSRSGGLNAFWESRWRHQRSTSSQASTGRSIIIKQKGYYGDYSSPLNFSNFLTFTRADITFRSELRLKLLTIHSWRILSLIFSLFIQVSYICGPINNPMVF